MINTSNQYKNSITNDRTFICKATVTLVNGTALEFDNDNIMSFKYEDSVSSDNSFDVGSAIINKFTLQVDNTDETYSEYDFTGAVLRPTIGLVLPDGTVETLKKGVFTVNEAKTPGATILITALDNMAKFDKDYDSTLSYPTTLAEIVRDACSRCGVTLNTSTFTNSSYTVRTRPEKMTYREAISYAAQIAGCFARCNYNGQLELKWYDFSVFETNADLDGGNFKDYTSGDIADGGNFDDYSSGDNYDGGTFEDMDNYHHIYSLGSQDICTDDVVITGIKVTEDTEEAASYLYGTDGYVLPIGSNPFIQEGQAKSVATFLGQKIVGIRFRPLTVSAISDPSVEAGDMAYVSDRKGNAYQCCLTNINFSIGESETYKCGAETPARNSAVRYSATTKAIVTARQVTEKKITEYDKIVQQMNQLAANTLGFFQTVEEQEDGSFIIYRHDKPLLSDSLVVYKSGIDGFFLSRDGGKTYVNGIDSNGNAVFNMIAAIGINFDWASGGTLTLGGKDGVKGTLEVLDGNGVRWLRLLQNGMEFYNVSTGERVGRIGINAYSGGAKELAFDATEAARSLAWTRYKNDGTSETIMDYITADDTLRTYKNLIARGAFCAYNGLKVYNGLEMESPLIFGEVAKLFRATPQLLLDINDGNSYLIRRGNYVPFSVKDSVTFGNNEAKVIHFYEDIDLHGYQIRNQSDERLKNNIQPCNIQALDIVNNINLYSFDWIETGNHEPIAFVAQQVKEVVPELVHENLQDGHLSIKEGNMVRYLWKAVQELSEEVRTLKGESRVNKSTWEPGNYTIDEKKAFAESLKPKGVVEEDVSYN